MKRSEKYKSEHANSTTQVLIDILETLEEIRDILGLKGGD